MNSEPSILGIGWTEAEVRHFVGECYDRDTNLNVLLGYSAKYLEKRMILILGKKILQPFMIQGWVERSPEALKAARISRGEMPISLGKWDGEEYAELFEALDIEHEAELSAIPIPIGNRVTTMILGVPASSEEAGFDALSDVAKFVGTQLEKLIRLSKAGELPPKEERIPASPIRKAKDSDVSNETLQAYVLEATQVDIPVVPKFAEDDSEEDLRTTLTLDSGLGIAASSEIEDASPFRVVSEISDAGDEDEAGQTSFGLPLISEVSFGRKNSSIDVEVDDFDHLKGDTDIALDSEIEFGSIEAKTELVKESTGVSIMIPKAVTEETSHATLMGGIGVATELVEKSLRTTAANPSVVAPAKVGLKRATPGAAIFRARRKSGKVGGFIPQATKSVAPVSNLTETKEAIPSAPPIVAETRQTMQLEPTKEPTKEPVKESIVAPIKEPDPITSTLASDTDPKLPGEVLSDMKRKLADSEDLKKWDLQDEGEIDWDNEDVLDPAVFDNLTPTGELTSAAKSIILESGPLVVENQEYFMMIDSRDKKVAFSAAEKIAELGAPALPFLDSIFPGRIFVDRYQFTAATMPNAALHTPVLECLSKIGNEEAMEIPLKYLDDKSTETRFYAVFLLMNFDCGDRIEEIYERFFDKDQQIQSVSKSVLAKSKEANGFSAIIDRLRNEIQFSQKDQRVEIACEILAMMKDRQSVELFIDLLEEQKGRTQTRIHNALQVLTLKDWSTPYEWRHWWREANTEPRSEWLITALDSNNEFIRRAAAAELQQIPGLALNYNVSQPSKLRRRAQRELRSWFESLA